MNGRRPSDGRFDDPSGQVRYEAVQAYCEAATAAQGCAPLLDALRDASPTSSLAAIDALGDGMQGRRGRHDRDRDRKPGPAGRADWQREAHAFVALAQRDPGARARSSMEAFIASELVGADVRRARGRRAEGRRGASRSSPTTTTTTCAKRRSVRCGGCKSRGRRRDRGRARAHRRAAAAHGRDACQREARLRATAYRRVLAAR